MGPSFQGPIREGGRGSSVLDSQEHRPLQRIDLKAEIAASTLGLLQNKGLRSKSLSLGTPKKMRPIVKSFVSGFNMLFLLAIVGRNFAT
jgi:hypothetical protein